MPKDQAPTLSELPPEQRAIGKLPPGQSVQINAEMTRTEHPILVQGADAVHAFMQTQAFEDPSVARSNAYAKHLSQNVVCFASFIPKSDKDKDHVFDFWSQNGLRLINPGESVPVYFEQDAEHLLKNSVVRLSPTPLNKGVIDREVELNTLPYAELMAQARDIGATTGLKSTTRQTVVEACLVAEFGKDEVARNAKSTYAGKAK